MVLAVALVSAAGYLTYRSLSSIVASVQVKSRPDLRLLIIREIAADLDMAEYSVRLYRLTRDKQDIKPYYNIITSIDDKIDSLTAASENDSAFLTQVDTISSLIEENLLVWNDMIDLYHSDSLEIYIHSLTARIAVGTLSQKKPGILKRVFSRKAIREEEEALKTAEQKALLSDIHKIQQHDSIKNSMMVATESKLALTNNEIRERLYLLITRMENEVISSIRANAVSAQHLADETYRRLISFAILGSLLVLTVLIVVINYVRKIREYQIALEISRAETEKMANMKERFVANMSHEIRTPVNAISGFTGQLLHEKLNDKSRKMLEIIYSTSEHLVRVVNDILDFSKLQNNAIVPDRIHFDILPVFEEIRMLFLPGAQANNTRLYYTIGADTPEVLYGDSHRLKQILLNLVGNAVKFTMNGEIHFSADSRNFSGKTFELILSVRDTGIGIRKDMQDKVFDDFTQAEAGITRKFGGTGLGLSIVRKLVELHKGTIVLDSTEGKGTEITCRLPYQTGNRKLVKKTQEVTFLPQFVKEMKVLVVDDEEYNRLLFKTIFNRWELHSDEVADGSQALEKIRSSIYDLVFMDARMPGLSGLEASTIIRGELGIDEKTMPIIGTSATHTSEDLQIYQSAGMNAFLPKPFTERMLLDIIISVKGNSQTVETEEAIAVVKNDSVLNESGASQSLQGVNLKNLYHIASNDITFVKQMLNAFILSTEQGLHGLDDSIKSGDLKAVHEIAHKISSPCRHVGADRLYSNLKMIEEQSKNHENISILYDLARDSKTEFQKIKKDLQIHMDKI